MMRGGGRGGGGGFRGGGGGGFRGGGRGGGPPGFVTSAMGFAAATAAADPNSKFPEIMLPSLREPRAVDFELLVIARRLRSNLRKSPYYLSIPAKKSWTIEHYTDKYTISNDSQDLEQLNFDDSYAAFYPEEIRSSTEVKAKKVSKKSTLDVQALADREKNEGNKDENDEEQEEQEYDEEEEEEENDYCDDYFDNGEAYDDDDGDDREPTF